MIQPIRPCFDCMAVSASHNAFCNLFSCLSNALCIADVQCLIGGDVIEMERGRVRVESALQTDLEQAQVEIARLKEALKDTVKIGSLRKREPLIIYDEQEAPHDAD